MPRQKTPTAPEAGQALMVAPKQLRSVAELLASAGATSDFSYRIFESVNLDGASFHRSLFTGSLFRTSRFTGVDWSRSDLDGFKAESCTFIDCRFEACDIRSSAFDGCTFSNCSFDEALIKDCTFDRCEFFECSWQQTVTTENSFDACTFTRCPFSRSSFMQNRISLSRLVEMTLGECSFVYVIFSACEFERCAINAESVGLVFGIAAEDLLRMRILHSGEPLPTPDPSRIIDAFLFEYARRGWSLGVCVMRLNFRLTAELYAIHEFLQVIESDAQHGFLLKREELDFLARVLTELHAADRLPLMALADAMNVAWSASKRFGDERHAHHAQRALRSFTSSVALLMQDAVARFEQIGITERDLLDEHPVTMTVVFERKPGIRLQQVLPTLRYERVIGTTPTRLLDVRRGSHVEVLNTAVGTLLMFNILLLLLNSALGRWTELQARLLVVRRKTPPRAFIEKARRPSRDTGPVIDAALKKLMTVAFAKKIVNSPELKGLMLDNIRSIDVTPSAPTSKRRRAGSGSKRRTATKKPKLLTAGSQRGKKPKKRSSE